MFLRKFSRVLAAGCILLLLNACDLTEPSDAPLETLDKSSPFDKTQSIATKAGDQQILLEWPPIAGATSYLVC